MKLRVPFKLELIIAFSLAGIALNALSFFFFTRLDNVVHTDLYRYGLQFSNEWAEPYWDCSKLLMSFLGISMLLIGLSMLSVLIHARTHGEASRKIGGTLLIFSLLAIGFSIFFFNRLDYIIHHDLYAYGLQFNSEWVAKYWTYAGFILSFQGISIVMIIISAALISLSAFAVEVSSIKLVRSSLLVIGAISLVFSIIYNFLILAFIGLGLAFWGAVLIYIRDEKYARQTVLDAITVSSLETISQIMQKLDYKGIAIYLPPKYFKDPETSKVCILKEKDGRLLVPKQLQSGDAELSTENEILFVTPPGAELMSLFQKVLNTSFTKVDLQYVRQNLAKVIVEDLEIARELKIYTENDKLYITIKDSIFNHVYKESLKRPEMFWPSGSPISSAIACILAKATGKPIVINKDQVSEDGQIIMLEYTLLEETEKEQS